MKAFVSDSRSDTSDETDADSEYIKPDITDTKNN